MASILDTVRTVIGTGAMITEENWEEFVERALVAVPSDKLRNPEGIIETWAAVATALPRPVRKIGFYGFINLVQNSSRIPEWVKAGFNVAFAPMISGTDAAADRLLDEGRVDPSVLRAALLERWRNANPVGGATGIHAGAATAATIGAAGTLARDGGRTVHRTGHLVCDLAKSGSTNASGWAATGSIYEMLMVPGNTRCRICFPEAEVKVVITPTPPPAPPAEPPKPPTVESILRADRAGDGHIGRALDVLRRIMELREAEIVNEPTGFWVLKLIIGDGIPKVPRALEALPAITPAQVGEFDVVYTRIRAAHDAGTPQDPADIADAIRMVRWFSVFFAELPLLVELEIPDVSERARQAMDFVDDRITAQQREWLVGVLRSRRPWIILAVGAGVYVLAILGSGLAGIGAWLVTFAVTGLVFAVGAVLEIMGFVGVLFGGGWPFVTMLYLGWAGVVCSRLLMPLLDFVSQLVRGGIRGTIPGAETGWFTWVIRRGSEFARARGWLPAVPAGTVEVPITRSSWWLDTALVISVASCIVGIIGGLVYTGNHFSLGALTSVVAMALVLLILQAADIYKRLRHLLPWAEKEKDAIATKNAAIRLVKWGGIGLVTAVFLLACAGVGTGLVTAWIGWDNIAGFQAQSRQEACEAAGTCAPEHYRNSAEWQGYCQRYPQARECRAR